MIHECARNGTYKTEAVRVRIHGTFIAHALVFRLSAATTFRA
jgi:hypothetical protein